MNETNPTPRQVTNYYVCLECREACETYLPSRAFTVTPAAREKLRLSLCCSAAVRIATAKG